MEQTIRGSSEVLQESYVRRQSAVSEGRKETLKPWARLGSRRAEGRSERLVALHQGRLRTHGRQKKGEQAKKKRVGSKLTSMCM